jgi:hypothetical protein
LHTAVKSAAFSFAENLHRLTAAGAAALILLLTVLAASPQAHEEIHHDCHHDEDHACAVVLFAQGVWASLDVLAVPRPDVAWCEFVPLSRPELRLVTPRYLRQPERGPPVC